MLSRPALWALLGPFLGSAVLVGMASVPGGAAEAQVQLRCDGALIDTRGTALVKRSTSRLGFSLGLEADGVDADAALGVLQQRLAAVRTALQRLEVQDLRVSSPSTWNRAADSHARPRGADSPAAPCPSAMKSRP